MNRLLKAVSIVVASTAFFVSCTKTTPKLPTITFKTDSTYISKDTIVGKKTLVLMGVKALKAEPGDLLTRFYVNVSYDGNPDTTLYSEDVTSTYANGFSKDFQFITRNVSGKEKYTFNVVNKSGALNNVSVTLTVDR